MLPEHLCVGVDVDTENLKQREGRRSMTSVIKWKGCIHLIHKGTIYKHNYLRR